MPIKINALNGALASASLMLLSAGYAHSQSINPRGESWGDSYLRDGKCYCKTTYDHGLDDYTYPTPAGIKTIREICEVVGNGPGWRDGIDPIYNTVQCGHEPGHDEFTVTVNGVRVQDEKVCPGRVDIGAEGCQIKGPLWDLSAFGTSTTPTPTPTPAEHAIPGTIQAEDASSSFGIRTQATSDDGGGLNVGWIQNGDYIAFDTEVETSGNYIIEFRVSAKVSGSVIDLSIDGSSDQSIDVPNTGGDQNWISINSREVFLQAGTRNLRLDFSGSNGYLLNINWISATIDDTVTPTPTATPSATATPAPTSTPTPGSERTVVLQKRNTSFALDGNKGETGETIYLWSTNTNNVNQQWVETDQGGGYYSYKKIDTNVCIDSGDEGRNQAPVTMETCNSADQEQHWRRVSVSGSLFRLESRAHASFSIDGNHGADFRNPVYLYRSGSSNVNQHWEFFEQ